MSFIVKLRISIPILPTSGDATSRTRAANASRSLKEATRRETQALKGKPLVSWPYCYNILLQLQAQDFYEGMVYKTNNCVDRIIILRFAVGYVHSFNFWNNYHQSGIKKWTTYY